MLILIQKKTVIFKFKKTQRKTEIYLKFYLKRKDYLCFPLWKEINAFSKNWIELDKNCFNLITK